MRKLLFIFFLGVAAFCAAQDQDLETYKELPGAAKRTRDVSTEVIDVYPGDAAARKLQDTPLMRAVKARNAGVVKTLIGARADVNEKNYEGGTPLYKAAELGNLQIVKMLVAAKAEINEANNYAITPLMAASAGGSGQVVKYLIDNGADVNKKDVLGKSALLHAADGAGPDTVKYLLAAGADIEDADKYGETPLITALKSKNDAVAADLINRGADLNAKSSDGVTARVLAKSSGVLAKKALIQRLKQQRSAVAARPAPAKPAVAVSGGVNRRDNINSQNAFRPAQGLTVERK